MLGGMLLRPVVSNNLMVSLLNREKLSWIYRVIKDAGILLIEGIHSFNEIIRNKADLKIFIDADDHTLWQLRFAANIHKRGFPENEAGKRIGKEMEEYHFFVAPGKKYADITIHIDEKYHYVIRSG